MPEAQTTGARKEALRLKEHPAVRYDLLYAVSSGHTAALGRLLGIGGALGTLLIANAAPPCSAGAGRTGGANLFAVFVFCGGGEGELASGGNGGGTFG